MKKKERTFDDILEELQQYFYQAGDEDFSKPIKNILEQNDDIKPQEYIITLLNFLENIIPENVRKNFYRNLRTLLIELNFDYDFSNVDENTNETLVESLRYYPTNELIVNPVYLKIIITAIQRIGCSIKILTTELKKGILHELCHMASIYYDEEKKIYFSGFSANLFESNERSSHALTEGMTEVIAWEGITDTIKTSSGYYVESLFVMQLMQIVGKKLMLESYFGNKGTIEIEKELDKFSYGILQSDILLSNIEENFLKYKTGNKEKQTLLASIQITLIEYYRNKMLYLIENKLITKEAVEESLVVYEDSLIRPEIMKEKTDNIEIFVGLDESIERFNSVKQEMIDMLSDNYTMNGEKKYTKGRTSPRNTGNK